MNITNRARHATAGENAHASVVQAASLADTSLPHVTAEGIDVSKIQYLTEILARQAGIDQIPQHHLEMLQNLAHEVFHVLEADHLKFENGPCEERRIHPVHLPPFPPVLRMLSLTRDQRERRLEKRATELLLEIEGLRSGLYVAPPGKTRKRMLEQARRRFRRLHNTAMQLGFWTDGRWDAGEEETHLV